MIEVEEMEEMKVNRKYLWCGRVDGNRAGTCVSARTRR